MIPRHWTPRYLLDRSREWWFQKRHPDVPWLGPKAVQTLGELLHPQMQGLEIGAGRSTAWVARRVASLQSWEESPDWYEKVEGQLEQQGITNGSLQHTPNRWADYEILLWSIPEASLDFALVDSESNRAKLCLHLLPKIRNGGFLMLDNANWFLPSASRSPNSRTAVQGPTSAEWVAFLKQVSNWQTIWTSSGVTDTAFFIRPQ